MTRTDINKVAETLLIPLFSEVYGYTNLQNLNDTEGSNYPGIDLGDERARVAFQITSTSNSEKIKKTLRKFVEYKLYEKYDRLIIYILTEKQQSYSGNGYEEIIQNKFAFDKDKNIWDYRDILKAVANLQVNQVRRIEAILEENFGEERRLTEWEVVDKVEQTISEYTQLFVGREEERQKLARFLQENSSGLFLVTAPAGFGKTALLANWVKELQNKDCDIAYHFFNERTRSIETAYRNLIRQLDADNEFAYDLSSNNKDNLRTILYNGLRSGRQTEKPLIIVIDGLDEAGETFLPPFPNPLPENVFVIASARAEKGQEQQYLEGWKDCESLHLERLSKSAIAQWLREAGNGELAGFADDTSLVNQLDQITQGFPLYLSCLIDELLHHAPKHIQNIQELLAHTPQGFEEYVQQQIKRLDELDLPDERWQFFALLAVAKGALTKEDIKAVTKMRDRQLRQMHLCWQVTRWMRITADNLYAFAHPLLATTFAAHLGDEAEDALQDLIDYCSRWQKYQSHYALRYYPEHLQDEKRWEELYAIARNPNFAAIQDEQLPNEPDLPLKTMQIALLGAADQDDAGGMAKFLLLHAQRLKQITVQDSPLEALRKGSLQRAWKLADQFEIERCILWYLLLAWELKDEGRFNDARETLKKLQKKDLPRFSTNWNISWQGDYAAYIMAYIFDINKDTATVLIQQLFENDHRRILCKALTEHGNFDDALETADMINQVLDRVSHLEGIAKAQAAIGQRNASRSTFGKALEIIHKVAPHILWVDEMVSIAEAQVEALEDVDAARNTLENARAMLQNVVTLAKKQARDIEDKENQKEYFLQIEKLEPDMNKLINDTMNYAQIYKNKARNSKTKNNSTIKHNSSLGIAYTYAKAENFTAILEALEQIEGLVLEKALASIANALAEEGLTKTARVTFAKALQILHQEAETPFLQSLALSDVVDVQVSTEQNDAGRNTISLAHQIAQKINNPAKQVIAMARIAKGLFNIGSRKDARVIFDSFPDIVETIKIQAERVNSFKVIANIQVTIQEFTGALNTAQRIEFPEVKAKSLGVIGKALVEAGHEEEYQTTFTTALEIAEDRFSFMEWLWVDIMCEKAMAQSFIDKKAAISTLKKVSKFTQIHGKQRDKYFSKIARAEAQIGLISHALKTTDNIEDNVERLIALSWIALSQFEQGKQEEVLKTLTVALQIQDQIKEDKQKLIKALKTIAGMQAMAGKGEDAVKTAEKILTERNLYLPGIASWLVKTGDKENFKRLLIPCAYNVETAYQMCGLIARLYPEQAELVAKAVTDLN
ncbi:MAG: SMEK domain-containing protein [Coleofasciculus chthonoplastes F3-SA18-01]